MRSTAAREAMGEAGLAPLKFAGQLVVNPVDAIGNAREWLQDCWTTSYRGRPQDGRAWEWGGGCELRGGELAILGLKKEVKNLRYDAGTNTYRPAPADPALDSLAVAYYQTAYEMFREHRYVPTPPFPARAHVAAAGEPVVERVLHRLLDDLLRRGIAQGFAQSRKPVEFRAQHAQEADAMTPLEFRQLVEFAALGVGIHAGQAERT